MMPRIVPSVVRCFGSGEYASICGFVGSYSGSGFPSRVTDTISRASHGASVRYPFPS
jgi:hypothetical protein